MREPVRDKGRLEHILKAIDNVFEYTKGMDYEGMVNNKILCHAVIYNIQIIGEDLPAFRSQIETFIKEIDCDI